MAQAYGQELVLNVGLNDVKARKAMQNLNRDVRQMYTQLNNEVRHLEDVGDFEGALKAKREGYAKLVEAQKKAIEQQESMLKNSGSEVPLEAKNALQQQIDKAKELEKAYNNGLESSIILSDAQEDKLQKLMATQEAQTKLQKAHIATLKAEGKEYEVLKQKIDLANTSIDNAYAKRKLVRQGLKNLEKDGKTDTPVYQRKLLQEERLNGDIARGQNVVKDYRNQASENFVKNGRSKADVEADYKRMESYYKAEQAKLEALKATGSSDYYDNQKEQVRIKRMADLANQIKAEKATLTKAVANTDTGDKISTRIAKMQKEYGTLEDEQRKYGEGLDDLNLKNQKTISTLNAQVNVIDSTGKHFKAQFVQVQALSQEVKLLSDQREREQAELQAVGEKYGEQSTQYVNQARKVSDLTDKEARLNARIVELNRNTGGAYNKMSEFADYISQHQKVFDGLATSMSVAGKGMMAFGGAVGVAIGQGTKLNYELEQTNQTTKALLDNAGKENPADVAKNMKAMQQDDVKLSEQWGVSQDSIAKAQQTLAHRGYESDQVKDASNPLLQASIATGYGLDDVTDVTTSALEAFGLRAKGKKMGNNTRKVANTISYASDLSASSFKDTGTALSYVGATAKSAGYDISQTSSAIAELSLSGVHAQKAGTGLRKILNSLISPTKAGKEELQKLGVTVTDSQGKLKPFSDIMSELHDKMQGMTGVQKNDIFHNLFGTTGQASAAILVNNSQALGEFNKKVDEANSKHYMENLAKQKMDNPINQINRMKTAWQEMTMQMASTVGPGVTAGIKDITNLMNDLNNASPGVKKVFEYMALGIPVLGALLVPFASMIRNIRTITSVFNRFTTSFDSKTKSNTSDVQALNEKLAEEHELLSKINEDNEVASATDVNGNAGLFNKGTGSNNSTISKAEQDAEGLSQDAKTAETVSKDAEDVSKMSKLAKFAKVGTAGMGFFDVLNAGTDLIGANKNNIGEKAGNATGNLTGAVAGGALGTALAGPVGTMLGSAIGSSLGDKLGGTIGKSIQDAENNARKKQAKSKQKESYHQATGTTGAVQGDMEKISGYQAELTALERNKPKDPTAEYKNAIKDLQGKIDSAYKDIENKTQGHINKMSSLQSTGDKKALQELGINENQYNSIVTSQYQNRQKSLQSYISDAEKLEKTAGGKRSKAYQQIENKISDILSIGSKNQKKIRQALSNSTKKISDGEAKSVIKDAKKELTAMEGKHGKAQKMYDDEMSTANDVKNVKTQYYKAELSEHKISQDQYNKDMGQVQSEYNKAKSKATNDKKQMIQSAQDQYNAVIKWAIAQTADHGALLDLDTKDVQDAVGKQKSAIESLIKSQEKAEFSSQDKYKKYKYHGNLFDRIGQYYHNSHVEGNKQDEDYRLRSKYGLPTGAGEKDVEDSWYNGKATGGKISSTQLSLVNEKGMESAYNPTTNKLRFFGGGPQVTKLFSGEYVLNAQDTYKLTHGGLGDNQTLNGYADGTTSLDDNQDDDQSGNGLKIKNIHALNKFSKYSKDIWQDIHDDTKDKVDRTHDHTVKQLTDMKKSSLTQFQNIHDGTISSTKDLMTNYQNIFGKLPTMTQQSVSGSITQLNRGFSGINQTLNQFGSHQNVLQPIHYAGGSNGAVAREHDAIVNDATAGNQQEAIIRDDGIFLPKYKDALVHLNSGDAVLNGEQTRQFLNGTGLAHYANGSGVSDDKLKSLIAYGVKHPGKLLDKDFSSKVNDKNGSALGKGFNSTSMSALNGQMLPWYQAIYQVLNDATGESGSASAFLRYAKDHYMGDSYQLGANGPDLYDCSSMIESALSHFGIQLGRTTTAMQASNQLTRLGSDISKARAGDLVLFGHGDGAGGHVGIVNNPARGTMFNETPPRAGITAIDDVTSLALDGYYRINGLADKDKKQSALYGFAKKQLGKDRLDWVAKHLGEFGDFNGTIPTGDHASLLKQAGIPESDWADFNYIISHESGWNPQAVNPQSGAYGLPQALPANKMLSAGGDWRTNPVTQLKWQKAYIESRYGSADNARKYWEQHHNYEHGGLITSDQIAHVGEGNKPEMVLPLTDKFRTVQLAKQAVDFVNSSDTTAMNKQAQDTRIDILEKSLETISNDMEKLVKLTTVLAQNSANPVKAYVTTHDLTTALNTQQKKSNIQKALRRGEQFV